MKINWNLRSPKAETSPVRLVIHHRGQTYNKSVGITVPVGEWKVPKRGPQYSSNPTIAAKITDINRYLLTYLNDFSTDEDIKRVLDGIGKGEVQQNSGQGKETMTFWEYYDQFSNRQRPNLRQFRSVHNKVAEIMGRGDNWDDIDEDWERRLVDGMNERGYSDNYKAGIIAKIKTAMQEALDLGYHTNTAYKKFKKKYTPADSIWLTADEIEALWNLDLKGQDLAVRDLFLLGFYTAARFSDYSHLEKSSIRDGVIHIVSQKTNVESLIPCSPRVVTILERHGGKAPVMSQQELNREIKKIAMFARINEPITTSIVKGGKLVREVYPKYKLVSSHTARRSAATQLTLQGVPERSVMMITGHKTHQAFATYVRLNAEQNAELLKETKFFK